MREMAEREKEREFSQNLSSLSYYIFLEFLTWLVALPSFAGKNSTCTIYEHLYVVLHDGKVEVSVIVMISTSFLFPHGIFNLHFNRNAIKHNNNVNYLYVVWVIPSP